MHDTNRQALFGTEWRESGVESEAGDIIDEAGTRLARRTGDRSFSGVNRDGTFVSTRIEAITGAVREISSSMATSLRQDGWIHRPRR